MSIWGKIIGGTAGFALGGPLGAILGVMAGNVFDKSKKTKFNFNQISNQQKQNIFALSIIILSAKIAKSDGVVTQDEIIAFKEKFKIPPSEMSQVAKIFDEAKKSKFGYEKIANQVGMLFSGNQLMLEELLNNLFFIAEADGNISVSEIDLMSFAKMVNHAKSPLFILGYGIRLSGCLFKVQNFIKKYSFRFVTTWTASDYFATKHPQNIGVIGTASTVCSKAYSQQFKKKSENFSENA